MATQTQVEAETVEDTTLPSPKKFKSKIAKCKRKRVDLVEEWSTNVDYRRGKPTDTDDDEQRLPITDDWWKTKAKEGMLFSQRPQVVVTTEAQDSPYKPAAHPFQRRLNFQLKKAKAGVAMREVLPDIINAAGVGGILTTMEARIVELDTPAIDVEALGFFEAMPYKMGLKKIPMKKQPQVTDRRFKMQRISPTDLLWDVDFGGSDFDDSGMVGHSGRMPWGEASASWALTEEDKEKCLGDVRQSQDRMNQNAEDIEPDGDIVSYDEIWFWRYMYLPEEKYYKAIHHMVFVNGIDKPVVNEPWKGQRFDEEIGTYIGACRFPLQIGTINYISDECIPPSDSAAARPITNEKMRFRYDIQQQRDHSKPIRWFDVNRVDADIQANLMEGDWQGFIPTQGAGDKSIGEVARSNHAREDFEANRIHDQDSSETWGIGPNGAGTFNSGRRSATEANNVQENLSTRVAKERALIVGLFLGSVDVLAGLMCLYDDFDLPQVSPGDAQRLTMWDRSRINHELIFTIRPDATILLDANQRFARLERFLNIGGKSKHVNPQEALEEMAAITGLDPATSVPGPPKSQPEPPNVSMRLTGAEDLSNPLVVGMLMESGQFPTMETIMKAAQLIAAANTMGLVPPPPDDDENDEDLSMKDDRPDWQTPDRINSRTDAAQN